MKNFLPSDSNKPPPHLKALNPQSWLQVERGKLSKTSSKSSACSSSSASSSIESLIKIPEPPILLLFKPVDYVEVIAQIHEELESCSQQERPNLYLLQYHVFKGLGDGKLMRRILRTAWQHSVTIHEKVVFGAWLKYGKQGEEIIAELLASCGKPSPEFGPVDISSLLPAESRLSSYVDDEAMSWVHIPKSVVFRIEDEQIVCDRRKFAALSPPFRAMLNGPFTESLQEDIDMSANHISSAGMKAIREFSLTSNLIDTPLVLLLEILVFANKFCCEKLKDVCDRAIASLICAKDDAVKLIEFAFEENSPAVAASCLQVFLQQLPSCLSDERVVEILSSVTEQERKIMVGSGSFSLYSLLSEVSMNLDPQSDMTARFLEILLESSETSRQRVIAAHQLGCVRLLRKEYDEAKKHFESAVNAGHLYSVVGLARLVSVNGQKQWAYEKLSSIISAGTKLGWMYQERALYCEGEKRWQDLEKATELDPTLTFPYMYRASSLMRKQNIPAAIAEINRVLGFKLALECLEVRFYFNLVIEDYQAAFSDIQAILTLSPDYKMFEGRVAASQLRTLVSEHVEHLTAADCWLQLYNRWSSVDDIGSLSIIYQMLESDAAKGVLYFRQSLLLLRLNCPEAAMRSLQLARQHALTDHERLVFEGWMLYDTGHCEEGLQKAEESIKITRSFEAFFLKAYALADSNQDPTCAFAVVSLLEDALKCPSDRLRKGQALNNLGSVYVDCAELDLAADCYINALKIRHTRAHQGLARVHFLKNEKSAAYDEMTKLISKAKNNASAYEKRSEYCERELAQADLEMVTKLDPLRVYPYRYRAAVLMDSHKEQDAIAELSKAIAFKADVHLLHLRAAFHEHTGNVLVALRDCRAALSVDPNHQEMLELRSRVGSYEP